MSYVNSMMLSGIVAFILACIGGWSVDKAALHSMKREWAPVIKNLGRAFFLFMVSGLIMGFMLLNYILDRASDAYADALVDGVMNFIP